jgi:egghead protein (zeste-white 4 protein)
VPVDLPPGPDLRHLVVPAAYRTRHDSRHKARALQYAVERSRLPGGAWVMHLDEETHLTPSVVRGIRDAIVEEEASGTHRIGQGAILYHRHLDRHPFLTLADMVRTGDDLGRFHFQHRVGRTLFGLHGSFILVRDSVERQCDFDFGPEGSITEDAFWAVRHMALGTRSRWVNGFVVEQSTQSLADFVKQRRRWFAGLVRVVLYADTTAWIRLSLATFVAFWAASWIGVVTTLTNLVLGLRTPPLVAAASDFWLAAFVTTYVAGLRLNLRERGGVPVRRQCLLYVAQVVLIPAFALLEAAGVVAAFVRPERGFHVVRKSSHPVHPALPPASGRLSSVGPPPVPRRGRQCSTRTTSAPTRRTTPRSAT